jgi:prepilin-type N-terminal cleavage/methylation domain-containing protein
MHPSAQLRRAFTLVEMVVVLAVMGIALAISAPSLMLRSDDGSLHRVVANARRAALRRAEPMQLIVGEKGYWEVQALRSGPTPLLSGRGLRTDGRALVIEISPLGLCTLDVPSGHPRATLDPFSCTLTDSSAYR